MLETAYSLFHGGFRTTAADGLLDWLLDGIREGETDRVVACLDDVDVTRVPASLTLAITGVCRFFHVHQADVLQAVDRLVERHAAVSEEPLANILQERRLT